jgi:hypothetical protein
MAYGQRSNEKDVAAVVGLLLFGILNLQDGFPHPYSESAQVITLPQAPLANQGLVREKVGVGLRHLEASRG